MKFNWKNDFVRIILMSFCICAINGCSTQTDDIEPSSISLSVSDTELAVGGTSTTVSATVKDNTGKAVPKGTGITFETTIGTFSNGKSTYHTETVDDSGTVLVALMTGMTPGTAHVFCTVKSVSQRVTLTFTSDADAGEQTVVLPAVITLSAADADLAIGTSTAITANVTGTNGSPVNPGTNVIFTTTKGSFVNGAKSYGIKTNDESGSLTVSLLSSEDDAPGPAEVIVSSAGIKQKMTINFTQKEADVRREAASITLAASPATLPVGGSSAQLTATVIDNLGNPVSEGTSLTFSTTDGSFINDSSSYTISTLDDSGKVIVSLMSSNTAGTAVVTCSINGITQQVEIEFTKEIDPEQINDTEPATITLAISNETLPVGGASTAITATVETKLGNPVPAGTRVIFAATSGTFVNRSRSYEVTTPDDSGKIVTALMSPDDPGVAEISCESGGVTQKISVEYIDEESSVSVTQIQLRVEETNLKADGFSTTKIFATPLTATRQIVPNVTVSFETTRGSITSQVTTGENGIAESILTSDRYFDKNVVITARTQGAAGLVSETIKVSFEGITLKMIADPTNLLAEENPTTFSTLTVTLADAAGNPIPEQEISFTTDRGALSVANGETDTSGKMTTQLSSNSSGDATVTATGLGLSATAKVVFTRFYFSVASSSSTIRVNGETSTITATLLDNGVNITTPERIFFSSSLGTLFPYEVLLSNGTGSTTLTSGGQSGVATVDAVVTIDSTDPPTTLSSEVAITVIGESAEKVELFADPDIIATGSQSGSTIRAIVYDANDQPVGGWPIYFRIISGPGGGEYLQDSVVTTNNSGLAETMLIPGILDSTNSGVVVEANTQSNFDGSKGIATLTIAGPVASVAVGTDMLELEADGAHLNIKVSAIVTDINGNPVSDGTLVNFSVQAIEFDEDRDNDGSMDCWAVGEKNKRKPCYPDFLGVDIDGVNFFSDDVNGDNVLGFTRFNEDGSTAAAGGLVMSKTEDKNGNGILDTGEDINGNNVLDPTNSTVIDRSVPTENGVAAAQMSYLQAHAANIRVRITAEAGGISNFNEMTLLCTEKMVEQGTCGLDY